MFSASEKAEVTAAENAAEKSRPVASAEPYPATYATIPCARTRRMESAATARRTPSSRQSSARRVTATSTSTSESADDDAPTTLEKSPLRPRASSATPLMSSTGDAA